MGFTIGALCTVLLAVFIVQVGKARELASIVRNDPNEQDEINRFHAGLGMFFMVAFLGICVWSFIHYIPTTLGWGPNTAASEHGPSVDYMFNLTLFFTSIVFFLTHIALFWFVWKYKGKRGKVGLYWAHNETLEMVWMIIPAVVMTFLVVGGLNAWNNIMIDLPETSESVVLPADNSENEYIEIEATGHQFAWTIRYPGRDGKIGTKYFTQINSANPLGQTWTDEKNMDDFITNEIVLPVNKPVRVRITSKDVLHNFYIRDMRVKMDAVPGMPTYFIFTPVVTTDSMRRRLSGYPEWQVPSKNDETKERWEVFNYELACAELCGKGHYSMRNLVKIVSEAEYLDWLDKQEGGELEEKKDENDQVIAVAYKSGSVKSQYFSKVYGQEEDPLKGKTANLERLVENKLYVKRFVTQFEELRKNAEYGSEEYQKAEEAISKLQPALKTVRVTSSLTESNTALEEAKALAASMMPTPEAPAAEPTEGELSDEAISMNNEETPE